MHITSDTRTVIWDMMTPILLITIAMLSINISNDVGASDVSPPTNISVTPLMEGRGLNISWDPEGTDSSAFIVYLVVCPETLIPLGSKDREEPYFVHTGLEPGQPYTYIVWPIDEEGIPGDAPSEQVVGWPRESLESYDPLTPPYLNEPEKYVSNRTVIISGSTTRPGSYFEVEVIHLASWRKVNQTACSSNANGCFILFVELMDGNNLLHTRVIDREMGFGNWSDPFMITLDREPPVISVEMTDGPYEVGQPILLSINGSTDNTGILRVEWRVQGDEVPARIEPTFAYLPSHNGANEISVTIFDLAGNNASRKIDIDIGSRRSAPRLNGLPSIIMVQEGEEQIFQMSMWVDDPDDVASDLTWFVSGGDPSLFTSSVDGSLLMLVASRGTSGEDCIQIYVEDPNGGSDEANITVVVESRSKENDGLVIPIVIITLGLLVSGPLVIKTIRHFHRESDIPDPLSTDPYFIKSVYLIHDDGRLIFDFHSADDEFNDPDMICGMFTAIQDFIKDSFNVKGPLENIIFGENHLTITHGTHVYLATVTFGALDERYLVHARNVLRRLEAEFAGVIEEWDGSYVVLEDAKRLIRHLLKDHSNHTMEDVIRRCRINEIVAVPSVDFHHGCVRYMVDIRNKTDGVIVDPYLDIQWDRDVLHLVRHEPEDSRSEGRFRMPNLHPEDEERIVLYFDPQLCLESFIRCNMTYMDVNGKLHTRHLENILADVNCPIFFTVNNANTAMLRKLVEELEHVDSKVYRYADILRVEDIYKLAMNAVGAYDIQFVMDYVHETPFVGEVWYYGETKIHDYRVVIKLTVKEETHSVEFLVATSLPMMVTGILAEIGQLFLKQMDKKYTHGYNVNRVVRRLVKDDSLNNDPIDLDQMIRNLKDMPPSQVEVPPR